MEKPAHCGPIVREDNVMKRNRAIVCTLSLFVLLGLFAGCSAQPQSSHREAIPFTEGQLYAAAYLGYQQIEDLDYYVQQYLDSDELPVHYLSSGDYYLIIPRYSGMELSLYRNDFDTSEPILIYRDPDCQPFLLQCNASDIFADATIRLTWEDETVEFSPFLSLKDGSVEIGDRGLDLTAGTETQQAES